MISSRSSDFSLKSSSNRSTWKGENRQAIRNVGVPVNQDKMAITTAAYLPEYRRTAP